MGTLKWHNASSENPGYSVYYANPERDPSVTYCIRQKRKTAAFTPTGWRVFARQGDGAFRDIYFAATLKEGKEFLEDWEKVVPQ